jgi:hypothetical protein
MAEISTAHNVSISAGGGGGGGSIPNRDTAKCQFVYVVFIFIR